MHQVLSRYQARAVAKGSCGYLADRKQKRARKPLVNTDQVKLDYAIPFRGSATFAPVSCLTAFTLCRLMIPSKDIAQVFRGGERVFQR